MFMNIGYFFGLVFLFFLSSCSSYETEGIKENITGGTSNSKDAASFSQKLDLTSTGELQNWLGTSFYSATNAQLHLNLQSSGHTSPEGSITYKGSFSISYTKESSSGEKEYTEHIMETGDSLEETQYNYVYPDESGNPANGEPQKYVWKAFFQDEFGSLLVILTEGEKVDECSSSDNCEEEVFFSLVNGAVYYRNWPANKGQGPLPPKKCWLVATGPYDCRTWKSGSKIDLARAVEPDGTAARFDKRGTYIYNEYVKLGTFKDLDAKVLFQIAPTLISFSPKPSSSLLAIKNKGKILRGVASVETGKSSRKLSSVKKKKNIQWLPSILLIALSLAFLGLLLTVFFKRNKELQ